MPKAKFTNKQKNEILKKVLKKTHQYYEEAIREQESKEMEALLEEGTKK